MPLVDLYRPAGVSRAWPPWGSGMTLSAARGARGTVSFLNWTVVTSRAVRQGVAILAGVTPRPGPGYPSPPELPEPSPATSRRAWGKVPYPERFRRQRRDLLDAAAGLAAEHGVAGTSVA